LTAGPARRYRAIVAARFPFPSFPRGWYVIAFSSELAPGEVRTLHYFDRDIVLYRGEGGTVAAVDKTCPHLGAHLGGGTVVGDCLRCPFHGWKFDADGQCVEVPYAPKIPPRARVATWPVVERNGVIHVWFDAEGGAPTWTPPELEMQGWTPNRTIRWEIRSHPQEVAENTVDAVIAPLVWVAVGGAPGVLAHRAVNTLDAMVGNRSARYERFGTSAARADDVMNWPAARFAATLTVLFGGRGALHAWRHDAAAHPSPNAGPIEAAFAGALGLTLGGTLSYAGRVEHRPRLGDGRDPDPADIARAVALARRIGLATALLAVAAPAVSRRVLSPADRRSSRGWPGKASSEDGNPDHPSRRRRRG